MDKSNELLLFMKKLFSCFALLFVSGWSIAEPLKTVFNAFTGKSDYITRIDSNTIVPGTNITVTSNSNGTVTVNSSGGGGGGGGTLPLPGGATNYIQVSTGSLQQGATFYVSSGTISTYLNLPPTMTTGGGSTTLGFNGSTTGNIVFGAGGIYSEPGNSGGSASAAFDGKQNAAGGTTVFNAASTNPTNISPVSAYAFHATAGGNNSSGVQYAYYGQANGTSGSATNYGGYFLANGNGTNYGALCNALSGSTNYCLYAATGLVDVVAPEGVNITYGLVGATETLTNGYIYASTSTAVFDTYVDSNSSTAQTIDWTKSNDHWSRLTGNVTYTFTAPLHAATLKLIINTGNGGFNATWPGSVHWSGGTAPTITTTANKVDVIACYYDEVDSEYLCVPSQNF